MTLLWEPNKAKVVLIENKGGRPKKKKEKIGKKVRAHQTYRKEDGTIVPGATTIVGQLGWNKQTLVNWANRIGLEGISANKYRDEKADIGILAHAMITDRLSGKRTDTSEYSKNQIDQAENSVLSFWEWEKDHKIEPILIEKPLVSETFGFGGTLDIYARSEGVRFELVDLKTGSGIYPEHFVQVVAYWHLLIENGYGVDKVRILNIPRAESETFQEQVVGNIDLYWGIFLNLLDIYQTHKKIKGK